MGILSKLLLAAMLPLQASQDAERIQSLIQALGDASKEERSKAVEALVALGRPALDALKKALSSSDPEVKGLASQAIEKIEWSGVELLRAYVKDHFDDGTSLEPAKMKGFSKWFKDLRLFEASGGAQQGNPAAVMMAMQTPRSLFAVKKFEPAFHRLIVKGIYCTGSVSRLVQKEGIVLADDDAALDFAVGFTDLASAATTQSAAAMMMMGGGSRLERGEEGWTLHGGTFGTHWLFKTGKGGALLDILPKGSASNPWSLWTGAGGGADAGAEERARLETEKLKLEVEALKRQLDKK